MFGIPNPETPCQLTTNCECCLSQMLFLEDGICITINPCFDGGETYTMGTYAVTGIELSIISENWQLVKKNIWDPRVDLVGEPSIEISKKSNEPERKRYLLHQCNNTPFMNDVRDGNYAAGKKQILPTASQFFQLLKKEGVWDLLMKGGTGTKKYQPAD